MLVQENFGWCKSLLLLLCHGQEKTACQRVFVCLGIWHWHVCITQHVSKSCKAWLRSKLEKQVCTSTYQVHTHKIMVRTSTYSEQLCSGLSRRQWRHSDLTVLQHKYILGAYLVWHSASLVRTTSYHAIVSYHLVLLCCGTYYPVPPVTILRISTFYFGTQYIQICTALIAVYVLSTC